MYYYLLPSVRPIPALTVRCNSFPLFVKTGNLPISTLTDSWYNSSKIKETHQQTQISKGEQR